MRSTNRNQTFLAVLFLFLAGCQTPGEVTPVSSEDSGIRGRILLRESREAVAGAHVYAYRDYSKNLIGVADFVSKGSAADGSYSLEVPPGEYYLVARKRATGANYGPLVTGDLYDHRFEEEAVRVQGGRHLDRDFHLVLMSEPLFFQAFTESQRKTGTGIRGRILDASGQPVQGAFATAYMDSNMKRLPDFASTLTGDDGGFTLYLPEGGRWFVGARSHARGVPEPGEPTGRYEGSEDHSLRVETGTFLDGIEIVLKPFRSQVPEGYKPY